MNAQTVDSCELSVDSQPISEIVTLLERARELVESSKLKPQRPLPIPSSECTAAMMRRYKKDRSNYPKNDCSANRARAAADIAANYIGLNHEQKYFFYAFVSNIAAIAHQTGFREGLNYKEVKARREKLKEAA